MNIYLIRHTIPDIELVFCYGQTDLDIKDSFETEVKRIKSVLPEFSNPVIYSSPLKRCAKLAMALDLGDVIFDERLKELNFGDWEMKRWQEIDKDTLNYWIEDFVFRQPPEGESYKQMCDRVMQFFNDFVLKNKSDEIILVSHGGSIRAILATILEMPLMNLFTINVDFAGVSKICKKKERLKVDYVNR